MEIIKRGSVPDTKKKYAILECERCRSIIKSNADEWRSYDMDTNGKTTVKFACPVCSHHNSLTDG